MAEKNAVDTNARKSKWNCQDDIDQFALKLSHLTVKNKNTLNFCHPQNPVDNDTLCEELLNVAMCPPSLTLVEDNIIMYLSGYVAKRALAKFPCDDCSTLLTSDPVDISASIFMNFKLYDSSCNLTYPSHSMFTLISDLEKHFRLSIPMFHLKNIMKSFVRSAPSPQNPIACPCHCEIVYGYVVKLYFVIRINHHLKQENENICAQDKRKNRKMMKLAHK
jgi:hypothetical protein